MSTTNLTTDIEDRDGIQLIRVAGPLDSMTHDQIKNLLDPLVSKPKALIVLDCENLKYVNSRGITLLARYHRAVSANMGFFGVAGVNSRILKGLELLGMGKLLHFYATVGDALKAAAALAGTSGRGAGDAADFGAVQSMAS